MIWNSSSTCKDPELARKALVHFDDRDREVGLLLQMVVDHLHVIHLVDMIARQDQDQIRAVDLQDVNVLVDGVGRPQIPVFSHALLGAGSG